MSDSGIFNDPGLLPYAGIIRFRNRAARDLEKRIRAGHDGSLAGFADYHLRFGLHPDPSRQQWVFTEWAPNAMDMFILCDKTFGSVSRNSAFPKSMNRCFRPGSSQTCFATGTCTG